MTTERNHHVLPYQTPHRPHLGARRRGAGDQRLRRSSSDADSSASTTPQPTSSGSASPAAAEGVEFNLTPEQNRVTTPKVDAIAAEVPQAIRDRGTLLVTGTRRNRARRCGFYATDDTTLIGSEVDFAYLIADVLGLEVESAPPTGRRTSSGSTPARSTRSSPTSRSPRSARRSTTSPPTGWTTWPWRPRRTPTGRSTAERTWPARSSPSAPEPTRRRSWSTGTTPTSPRAWSRSTSSTSRTPPTTTWRLPPGRIDGYFGPNPTAQYHAASTGETKVIGTFSGAGDALQGEIAVLTQEGQRLGPGVRRRHQPHHRERHLPAGARPLEPGQRGGRRRPRSTRPGLPKTAS